MAIFQKKEKKEREKNSAQWPNSHYCSRPPLLRCTPNTYQIFLFFFFPLLRSSLNRCRVADTQRKMTNSPSDPLGNCKALWRGDWQWTLHTLHTTRICSHRKTRSKNPVQQINVMTIYIVYNRTTNTSEQLIQANNKYMRRRLQDDNQTGAPP